MDGWISVERRTSEIALWWFLYYKTHKLCFFAPIKFGFSKIYSFFVFNPSRLWKPKLIKDLVQLLKLSRKFPEMDEAFKRNSWNLRQNSRKMLQFCSITRQLLGKNYCFFKLHHIRISILLSFTDFLEMLRQWFVKNNPTVILPYFAQ